MNILKLLFAQQNNLVLNDYIHFSIRIFVRRFSLPNIEIFPPVKLLVYPCCDLEFDFVSAESYINSDAAAYHRFAFLNEYI